MYNLYELKRLKESIAFWFIALCTITGVSEDL